MVVLRMKLAVVGEATSGKTALVQMAHSGGVTFPKNYMMTLGADLTIKELNVEQNTTVEMSIFDIGGQDLYRRQVPAYLEGSNAFLLVYDVSNKTTFETAKRWVDLCRKAKPNCQGYLVANKIDLIDKAEVSDSQAEIFCRTNGLRMFKTSALRGVGIQEALEEVAKAHVEAYNERCRQLAIAK